MAKPLSASQGVSDARIPATTGKLQLLQQFSVFGAEDGLSIRPEKDHPIYVGMESQACRVEAGEKAKEKKKGEHDEVG